MTPVLVLLTFLLGIYFTKPYEAHNLTSKYHVSTDLQNWFQALINCKGAGMELVSITSKAEQKELEYYLHTYGYNEGYWLSGTNLGNDNYFWASTGTPVIYSNWLDKQPDNATHRENNMKSENCIQWGLYNETKAMSGWNDLFCGFKLKYICQEVQWCNKNQ